MPQMAPISWLLLFIIFSITFIMFNIINYYNFMYNPVLKISSNLKSIKLINWKW